VAFYDTWDRSAGPITVKARRQAVDILYLFAAKINTPPVEAFLHAGPCSGIGKA
jgi:hypothetical protein